MDIDETVQQQVNVRAPPKGMSIRGLAGPFTLMAHNFAPGTTAADVESAMTPVGGHMEDCRIVKTKPFIVVEMVFASKEGADKVIETFNNQTVRNTVQNFAAIALTNLSFIGRWKGTEGISQDRGWPRLRVYYANGNLGQRSSRRWIYGFPGARQERPTVQR